MKEKLSYLSAGVIVYSMLGIIIDYVSNVSINWSFVLFWTIFMTLTDFIFLRKLKIWIMKKQNKHA